LKAYAADSVCRGFFHVKGHPVVYERIRLPACVSSAERGLSFKHVFVAMLVAVFLTVTGDAKAGLSGWNAAISADNPLNWYRFDEASGTSCADSGSDGLDGTYDGAILNQEGRFGAGTAVRFDGSGNNRVTFGSPSHLTGSWTVEYIVRKIGSASQALHDDTTTSIRLVQWGTNGVVGFTRYGVRDYTFNAQPGQDLILPTGQWVHLAFRKNSAGTQVFIDGVLAGTTTDSVDFPHRSTDCRPL